MVINDNISTQPKYKNCKGEHLRSRGDEELRLLVIETTIKDCECENHIKLFTILMIYD